MKKITIIILFVAGTSLHAQNPVLNGNKPVYRIRLTTINDNRLEGLLLEIKDSSVLIYPGKRKDWKNKIHYSAAEFGFSSIKDIRLKKKNGTWRGLIIGGGIGTAVFAGSLLIPNRMEKNHHAVYTFFAIPIGLITGAIVGSTSRKKFHINSSEPTFHEFQNSMR
ncbi:MAG: hypothetical protein ACHQFX_14360 [Chitinophagales bacterium]